MHIAIVCEHFDPNRGGAETYVRDLSRALAERGFDVTIVARRVKRDAVPRGVGIAFVRAFAYPRWLRTAGFAWASARRLRAGGYDCVIGLINTYEQDILIPQGGLIDASLEQGARRIPSGASRTLYLLAKRLSIKYLVCKAIERMQYDPRRKTKIVAVSRLVRNQIETRMNVERSRISLVYNAIDFDRIASAATADARPRFRAAREVAPEAVAGLFLGHNFALKGLRTLIAAMALLRSRGLGARLTIMICGGGRIEPYRAFAGRMGVDDAFRFLGFVENIGDAFAAADFFVLPTYYDPCSLSVFEALKRGLPVITTAANGAGELIEEGRQGFVVPDPESVESLAGALAAMLDDRARAAMARHASELGGEQSLERHIERIISLCTEVESEKKRARRDLQTIVRKGTRAWRRDAVSADGRRS